MGRFENVSRKSCVDPHSRVTEESEEPTIEPFLRGKVEDVEYVIRLLIRTNHSPIEGGIRRSNVIVQWCCRAWIDSSKAEENAEEGKPQNLHAVHFRQSPMMRLVRRTTGEWVVTLKFSLSCSTIFSLLLSTRSDKTICSWIGLEPEQEEQLSCQPYHSIWWNDDNRQQKGFVRSEFFPQIIRTELTLRRRIRRKVMCRDHICRQLSNQ